MAIGDNDITSANAVVMFQLTGVAGLALIPAPFQLQGFSADRVFETEAVEMAETVMGVDGRLSAGYTPNPVDQTYTLMPDSPSSVFFDTIINTQRTARTLFRINATIALPAISRFYTMTRGVLRAGNFIPGAGRVLEARTFNVRWESALSTPTA